MSVNKKKLVRQIAELLDGMRKGSPPMEPSESVKVLLGSDTKITMRQAEEAVDFTPTTELPTVFMLGTTVGLFEKAVDNIMADPDIARITDRAAVAKRLEGVLHQLFVKSLEERDLSETTEALIDTLRSAEREWRAFFPLVNVQFDDVEELAVGSVIIRPTGPWLGEPFSVVLDTLRASNGEPAEKALQQISIGGKVRDIFMKLPAVAETTVVCDGSLISEAAGAKVDSALNLLRCMGEALHPTSSKMLMGRVGDVGTGFEGILALGADGQRFTVPLRRVGFIMPFSISKSFVEFANERLRLRELSDVLSTEPEVRSEIEDAISRAINIAGVATLRPAPEERLVQFCTALETMLIGKGEYGDKKAAFCERLAWVVGGSSEDRRRISERAAEIYRERSNIVHKGSFGVSESLVTDTAKSIVRAMAELATRRDEFRTIEEVAEWVNFNKLQ